jgi:hypothetical protein
VGRRLLARSFRRRSFKLFGGAAHHIAAIWVACLGTIIPQLSSQGQELFGLGAFTGQYFAHLATTAGMAISLAQYAYVPSKFCSKLNTSALLLRHRGDPVAPGANGRLMHLSRGGMEPKGVSGPHRSLI